MSVDCPPRRNREKQRQAQLKVRAQRDEEQAEAAAEVEAQERRAYQKRREARDALHLKKTAQKRRLVRTKAPPRSVLLVVAHNVCGRGSQG